MSACGSSSLSKRAQAVLAGDANRVVPPSGGVLSSEEYNAEKNPNGVINMGTAENRLVYDLLREKLQSCWESPKTWADDMFMYSETEGVPELRDAIAKFLTVTSRACKPMDPNKMVIVNGADGALEIMAHIICDPGEAVLVPAPLYYALVTSVKTRPNVDVVPIPLSCEPRPGETRPYELTVDRAEEAYQKAVHEGMTVKGLFLVNPNNPLGDVYCRQQVLDLLHFANRHDLHVVLDEVYMSTIFEGDVTHYSIFQFKEDEIPDLEKVHFIWTFSKDLGMSGMRISTIYTWNDAVLKVLTSIANYHTVPTGWQRTMARVIADTDWFVNVFLPASVKRLKEAHSYFTQELTKLGIPYHPAPAGLYVWVDFSKFLSSKSNKGELALHEKFLQAGVEFTPSLMCLGGDRGWFRIVFSRRRDILEAAVQRIQRALQL